jgi:hypothetical protein
MSNRCIHKSNGYFLNPPERCVQIVIAVFKLHNFCVEQKLAPVDVDDQEGDGWEEQYRGQIDARGQRQREELITARFV